VTLRRIRQVDQQEKQSKTAVEYVSKKLGVPMKQVKEVIQAYREFISERIELYKDNLLPVKFGVLPIDSQISLNPGVTFIYGHESAGKTSIAKRIAISSKNQGLNTLYWDTENKLFLHDIKQLEGIALANSTRSLGVNKVVASGLTDLVVVDTLTSMEVRTPIIRRLRAYVPYIVLIAQMRDDWASRKAVPACYEPILSTSHTRIHLTGRERHKIEGVDLVIIQYNIDKYEADRDKEHLKGSFIITSGIVDNIYTSYDYLKSRGRIRSLGFNKILDGDDLGGRFKEVIKKEEIVNTFINKVWQDLHDTDEPCDINIGWYL
jgi:hypothetical protein